METIIDKIKKSIKIKHRFLKDSAFCKCWQKEHEDCVGCSSQIGCAIFTSIIDWEIYRAYLMGKITLEDIERLSWEDDDSV